MPGDGIAEGFDKAGGARPAEVAAFFTRTGVFGLRRQFLEFLALLEVDDDQLGVFFLVDQDVPQLVLGGAHLRLQAVVRGLDLLVADRMLLDVILDKGPDINRLPGQVGLCSNLGVLVQTHLLGLLDQQLTANQLFADGVFQLRRVGSTLRLLFGEEGIGDGLRDGNAVYGRQRVALGFVGGGRR
jgi:hypothetical protein